MAVKNCLLGIDIGTTHVKAAIFDETGKEVSKTVLDTPRSSDNRGWTTWDPEAIWCTAARAVSESIRIMAASNCRIAGVAAASMGESGVPTDSHGNPIYPIIAWYDPRTEQQARWWGDVIGNERTAAITGVAVRPLYSAPKILWLLENVPGAREKLASWLPISDFIAYKLSGNRFTDYSQASRTMLFDQSKGEWSRELLDLSRIPASILPAPVPSGTLVGRVTKNASYETQIPEGTPVFAGGHDHVCGALAVGAIAPGIVLDSCGTAESILATCPDAKMTAEVCSKGFSLGHHVTRDMHYVMGGIPSSGGSIEWFIRELVPGEKSYNTAPELAGASPPGARGVIYIPRLLGSGPPARDQDATGAFVRLRAHHTLADLARAVFEGLSFEARLAIESLGALLGQQVTSLVAIGGGAKNGFWLSVKASILGIPIDVPEVTESTALGAALIAGIGAGIYENEKEAVKKASRICARFMPDDTLAGLYREHYDLFVEVGEKLYQLDKKARS